MTSAGTRWPPRAIVRDLGLRTYERPLYRRGLGPVAGVDEAGRGACAGPMVVAACVLGPDIHPDLAGLTDSKKLTARRREQLFPLIRRRARAHAIIVIEPEEIDRRGVHVLNIEGMRRAVWALGQPVGYVLTDAFAVDGLPAPSLAVTGGDAAVTAIAAASVLAKVARDRIMVALDQDHPQYGFAGHKGYGTPAHTAALNAHGPSPVHRMSYANVAAAARTAGEAVTVPAGPTPTAGRDGPGAAG